MSFATNLNVALFAKLIRYAPGPGQTRGQDTQLNLLCGFLAKGDFE